MKSFLRFFAIFLFCVSFCGFETCSETVFAEIPAVPTHLSAPCVAHRGFSSQYPENTLTSMKEGIEVGASGNEMDIRLSTDGVLFLNHDGNLKRYTGEDLNPTTLTMAELRKRDVGSFKASQFKGEPIATFDEVIAAHVGTETKPVVELKQDGIEQQTLDILNKYNLKKNTIIIAFSAKACKKMRELDSEIFIAWLCTKEKEEAWDAYCDRIIAVCSDCRINAVDLEASPVTKELVDRLHAAGLAVFCWTVDDPAKMRQCLEAGVDSVTTNKPDVLLQVMQEMKK